MFGACSRAGPKAADIVNKIIQEMERRDVQLNTVSYNAQLSALVHCGLIGQAFELFSSTKAPQSTIETFCTLLLAAAKDRTEGIEKGLLVWNELVKKFKPNLYCYNTLLLLVRDGGIPKCMTQFSDHTTIIPCLSETKAEVVKDIVAAKELSLTFSSPNESLQLKIYISKRGVRWIEEESFSNILRSMEYWKIKPDIRTVSLLSSLVPTFSDILLLAKDNGIKVDDQLIKSASQLRRACGDLAGAKVGWTLTSKCIAASALQYAKIEIHISIQDLLKMRRLDEDAGEVNLHAYANRSKGHQDVIKVLETMKVCGLLIKLKCFLFSIA